MLVGMRGLGHRLGLRIPGPIAAGAFDSVALIKPAVEPNGGVERAVLIEEQVGELGLEVVGVLLGREVAAHVFAPFADGAREPMDDLPHARFAELFFAVQAGLAEVLRHDDVGGELRPRRRNLGPIHLEDHRTVGIGDDAGAPFPNHGLERVATRREATSDGRAAPPVGRRFLGPLRGSICARAGSAGGTTARSFVTQRWASFHRGARRLRSSRSRGCTAYFPVYSTALSHNRRLRHVSTSCCGPRSSIAQKQRHRYDPLRGPAWSLGTHQRGVGSLGRSTGPSVPIGGAFGPRLASPRFSPTVTVDLPRVPTPWVPPTAGRPFSEHLRRGYMPRKALYP